ncbi:MAG: ATP-binding protein [Chloroflexi bacterium OHK40]
MSHPISAFLARLPGSDPEIVRGTYTPATLGQLAQSLSRLVFTAPGGALLVAEGEQPRAWANVALRGVGVPVRRITLPAAPGPGPGFALIGMGAELGLALVGTPADPGVEMDEAMRLYEVRWSLSPRCLGAVLGLVAADLPEELTARAQGLREPSSVQMLRLTAELLDFTARQHATLAVTMRALNDRLRNHEDQTRMIVHDMRAPLHTLLISIRALQRQHFDPEGQSELLTVASDSAGYLLTLTETVLDSARLETSGWSLKRQPMRLHVLVQAVCDPFEMAARPDQARLRRAVAEDLPPIWLDRGLMERVLTNLVTNAIKYTPPSGEIRVSARLVHDGHAVELSVSDTGQGIPPEAQAHIFERFYQASDNDRRRGTGLGLYFCRLAVEAHGGSIAVQSALGQGSTFTILLPITGEGEG